MQLLLRDYPLTPPPGARHHSRPIFSPEDVVQLFPCVKHLHPHATDAYHYFTTGQARISAGALQDGFELVNESLSLLNGTYSSMHPDIGACNRLLARLSYVMGEHPAALLFQQRAAIISERVHGIDSPHTTTEYVHLALYCFACGHVSVALQLLYRARYLALIYHGEFHPEMAQIDVRFSFGNIGLMLQMSGEFDLCIRFLENALLLNRSFYGATGLRQAFTCHLLSRAHQYRGDFRTALDYEKLRYSVYKERLGSDNEYTRHSDECLVTLTQQAVNMARRLQERSGGKSAPPISKAVGEASSIVNTSIAASTGSTSVTGQPASHLQATGSRHLTNLAIPHTGTLSLPFPTPAGILELLNRVNGILVIQLAKESETTGIPTSAPISSSASKDVTKITSAPSAPKTSINPIKRQGTSVSLAAERDLLASTKNTKLKLPAGGQPANCDDVRLEEAPDNRQTTECI
ncbi:unnamed protein product [Protopolystoma xenopodis]|uniref:CLU central domain-containing protein n=1 Tax=Protopolystoma xenopodis TaxID=117903 RepID=A0A3S4ZPC9_9PLAT|nr:unnamed protein product [Protopolystoma xenopodis]